MRNDRDLEDRNRSADSSNMTRDRDMYDSESNPFVALRRFADEQISSLLQSITGLPSALSRPQSDRWMIFDHNQGYENMAYRQHSDHNNAGERGYTSDPGADSRSSGGRGESNNGERSSEQSAQYQQTRQEDRWPPPSRGNQRYGVLYSLGHECFSDLFEDHFLPISSPFFRPHRQSSLFDLFKDSNSPTWPITYIMFSPYSPLHLERQTYHRSHNERGVFDYLTSSSHADSGRNPAEPQWREAFEDLLRLENGKPMLDHQALTAAKSHTDKDWLKGLVQRGSLGDRWRYVSATDNIPWSCISFRGEEPSESEEPPEILAPSEFLGPTETVMSSTTVMSSKTAEDREPAESELELYERHLENDFIEKFKILQDLAQSPVRIFNLLSDEHQRRQNGWDDDRDDGDYDDKGADEQSSEATKTSLDFASDGDREPVPGTPVDSTLAESRNLVTVRLPRVISTMRHTERIRLPDGSLHTKEVRTKRFADGTEETEESVKVTHPQSGDGESPDDTKSGGGWFWKD